MVELARTENIGAQCAYSIRGIFTPRLTAVAAAAVSSGLFAACSFEDGFCYLENRRLTKEDFCNVVKKHIGPIGRENLTYCTVRFEKSNFIYAIVSIGSKDPSACQGPQCILAFDSCGNRVKI